MEVFLDRGSSKSARFKLALALLKCDEEPDGLACKDSEIATAIGTKVLTVERQRKRGCEVGSLDAIERKKREIGPREINVIGDVEAYITRLACSDPPEGRIFSRSREGVIVIDNLITQNQASLYKAFPPFPPAIQVVAASIGFSR